MRMLKYQVIRLSGWKSRLGSLKWCSYPQSSSMKCLNQNFICLIKVTLLIVQAVYLKFQLLSFISCAGTEFWWIMSLPALEGDLCCFFPSLFSADTVCTAKFVLSKASCFMFIVWLCFLSCTSISLFSWCYRSFLLQVTIQIHWQSMKALCYHTYPLLWFTLLGLSLNEAPLVSF